ANISELTDQLKNQNDARVRLGFDQVARPERSGTLYQGPKDHSAKISYEGLKKYLESQTFRGLELHEKLRELETFQLSSSVSNSNDFMNLKMIVAIVREYQKLVTDTALDKETLRRLEASLKRMEENSESLA